MYALTNINRHYLTYVYIVVWSRTDIETFCTVNINSYVSKELLTWLMKCCLVWSMYWWSLLITCLIRFLSLRTLCVFVCYVPSCICVLRALYTRLVHLLQAPGTPYLRAYLSYFCALKNFQNGFVVHQKVSIFQGLLKSLKY